MQPQSSYSSIKPRRKNRSDGSFKGENQRMFYTNYFKIDFNPKKNIIYQYDYSLTDGSTTIQKNSQLYYKGIKQIRDSLKQAIDFQMHKGQIVYGFKKQPNKTSINLEIGGRKLQACFKLAKQINLKCLDLDGDKSQAHILQLLNINLKNKLKAVGMKQMGKTGKYFETQPKFLYVQNQRQNKDKNKKELSVVKGIKANIIPMERQFALNIDICFRITQCQSFHKVLINQKGDHDLTNAKYAGQTVTAKYGNFRNYRIIQIDYSKTPMDKFDLENGSTVTYAEYFSRTYDLKIKQKDQPLIKTVIRIDKQIQNNKIVKKQIIGYLIPELVSLSGINDYQASQMNIMKSLSNITKLTPEARMQFCQNYPALLNKDNSFMKIGKPLQLQGQVLKTPKLVYQNEQAYPDTNGNVKKLCQLRNATTFKKDQYLFVYSTVKGNQKQDEEQADNVLYWLNQASKIYGVKFQQPAFLTVDSKLGVNKWIQLIQKDCHKNGTPKIIIFFLNKNEEKIYKDLKKFVINKLKCPSQGIRRRTFQNPKAQKSAASKLTIQMHVKMGESPWNVEVSHPYFKNRNTMYCGIITHKGKNGTYISFVGTIQKNCGKFYSTCKKLQNPDQNGIQLFSSIFVQWAKNYFKQMKKTVPEEIIIYREGLNQQQAERSLNDLEIPALLQMIKTIGEKTQTANYCPSYTVVAVNKKINFKFFDFEGRDGELSNPKSGSFVIQNMNESIKFELVPQYVTQGTCTPTRYQIMNENSKMPTEALIRFTYQQCFNYYNWEGAVRVPSCLQYANKLAKMVNQCSLSDIGNSEFNKMLFYL